MNDAILIKDAGHRTVLDVLKARGQEAYGVNFLGVSANVGTNHNELKIHLVAGQSLTVADQLLADIQKPTVDFTGLEITTNVGSFVVADVYNVTADPSDEKFVKIVLGIDDTNGAIEVFALEKTTGEYGALPAGKTFVTDVKEFSVPAAGTVLTEIFNFIK